MSGVSRERVRVRNEIVLGVSRETDSEKGDSVVSGERERERVCMRVCKQQESVSLSQHSL